MRRANAVVVDALQLRARSRRGAPRTRRVRRPRGSRARRAVRIGSGPLRTRRRDARYSNSGESGPGCAYGASSASSSSGMSRWSRSRNVAQLGGRQLLHLVGRVPRLDRGAERPPLHRLGEDDRGTAPVLRRHLDTRRTACGSRDRRAGGVRVRRRSGARPSCAGADRARRSARGCTRRTRSRTSGNHRRPSRSSAARARRRRRPRAAHPTRAPRSP